MSDDRPLDEHAPDDAARPEEDAQPEENPFSKLKPWQGKATRADKALLFVIFGVPLVYLALLPVRPWMLVNAPVLQEFINGAKTAVVAAAAYARIGEIPLWLVVVAGVVGMAKLDWAFWLAAGGATGSCACSPRTSASCAASRGSRTSPTGRCSA